MSLAVIKSLKAYHLFISLSRKGMWLLLVGLCLVLSWSWLTRVQPEEVKFVDLNSKAIIDNHMEKPHFSSLDAEGQPYEIWAETAKNITAENVELINPQGKITAQDGRVTTLQARKGQYTKETHFLMLREKVRLKDMLEGSTLTTDEAFIDLKNQTACGNLPIQGQGPTGSFWGQSFETDKVRGDLSLKGPAQLVHFPEKKGNVSQVPVVMNAEGSVRCVEETHKCIATKQAQVQQADRTLYADQLIAHFAPGKPLKNREIIALEAQGHVRFQDPSRTAFGDHAVYTLGDKHLLLTGKNLKILGEDQQLTAEKSLEYFDQQKKAVANGQAIFVHKDRVIRADQLTAYFKAPESGGASQSSSFEASRLVLDYVVAVGNVVISTPQQIARGKRGRYSATTELAVLEGNTEIVQGENLIQGEKAIINLKKNLATMQQRAPSQRRGQRVQALLIPRDLQKQQSFFKQQKKSS